MTDQEVFDFGLSKIREQGRGSYEYSEYTGVACKYRGPNGLKCVAGHFIPDSKYQPSMEGWGANKLDILNNEKLLYAMQNAHDNPSFLTKFEKNMQEIAGEFNLLYKPMVEGDGEGVNENSKNK